MALIIPVVENELNDRSVDFLLGDYERDIRESSSKVTIFNIANIGFSLITVPFWNFSLPLWFNFAFLLPMRVLWWYILLRLARGGG